MSEKDLMDVETDDKDDNQEVKLSRRSLLAKLGLLGAAFYVAPVLINLSDAEADRSRSRSRSNNRRRNRNRNRARNRARNRRRNRNRSRSRSRSRG